MHNKKRTFNNIRKIYPSIDFTSQLLAVDLPFDERSSSKMCLFIQDKKRVSSQNRWYNDDKSQQLQLLIILVPEITQSETSKLQTRGMPPDRLKVTTTSRAGKTLLKQSYQIIYTEKNLMLSPKQLALSEAVDCNCFGHPGASGQFFLSKPTASEVQYRTSGVKPGPVGADLTLSKVGGKRSLRRSIRPGKEESCVQNVTGVSSFSSNHRQLGLQQLGPQTFQNKKMAPVQDNKPIGQTPMLYKHTESVLLQPMPANRLHMPVGRFQNPEAKQGRPEQPAAPKISFSICHSFKQNSLCSTDATTRNVEKSNIQVNVVPKKNVVSRQIGKETLTSLKASEIEELQTKNAKLRQQQRQYFEVLQTEQLDALTQSPTVSKELEDKASFKRQKALSPTYKSLAVDCSKTKLQSKTSLSDIKASESREESSKLVHIKRRTNQVMSKMSEVEEIKSLIDSDEQRDSDKQSVVLGRLQRHNSTDSPLRNFQSLDRMHKLATFDYTFDHPSVGSTIMSSPHVKHRMKMRTAMSKQFPNPF